MKIGIKYCGGCNPRYDRGAAVRQFQTQFPELSCSPARTGEHYDLLLVLCGCTARCAEIAGLEASKVCWVCRQEEIPTAVEALEALARHTNRKE